MALKVGNKAPDFTLLNSEGKEVSFYRDVQGPSILYFYPKDFTPGCTREACEFGREFEFFENLEVPVFGISTDSVNTHKRFKERYELPFELLSDTSGAVTKSFKALIPVLNLPKRISYLISSDKKIQMVFENFFQAEKHISTLKNFLKAKDVGPRSDLKAS